MQTDAQSIEEYISSLTEDRQKIISDLRKLIKKNLPKGFQEVMNYGMIGYVVPLKTYPEGYHCNPKEPLPFLNLASQKNHIAIYHMGLYADEKLLDWFQSEYKKVATTKLDMGKSCIRFKKPEQIPLSLIGDLCAKMNVKDWILLYEKNIRKGK